MEHLKNVPLPGEEGYREPDPEMPLGPPDLELIEGYARDAKTWTDEVAKIVTGLVHELVSADDLLSLDSDKLLEHEQFVTAELYAALRMFARAYADEWREERTLAGIEKMVTSELTVKQSTDEWWAEEELSFAKAELYEFHTKNLKAADIKTTVINQKVLADPKYQTKLKALKEAKEAKGSLPARIESDPRVVKARAEYHKALELKKALEVYSRALASKLTLVPGIQGRDNAFSKSRG